MIAKRYLFLVTVLLFFISSDIIPQNLERPEVGIALSGGGALGFAHIGALKIIDSLNIPIDYVAGTSMGGLVGSLLSLGYSPQEMEQLVISTDWADIFDDSPKRSDLPYFEKRNRGLYQLSLNLDGFTPTVPSGLIAGQKISLLFSNLTYLHESKNNFDQLPIPFRCIAVDLITGKEVVLKEGSLSKAMRATMSIPSAFNPVEWGDYLLIDGGVLNNFPVDVARDMGADIVIGLNLIYPPNKMEDYNNLLTILSRTADIPRDRRLFDNINETDIYIEQNVDQFSLTDFNKDKISLIIKRGEEAARNKIPALLELKNKLLSFPPNKKERIVLRRDFAKTISSITLKGNELLDFEFINNLLDIKTGQAFDTKTISDKIMRVYGLGYFDTIDYEIEPAGKYEYHLIINIKEKSKQKVFFGLRYNDFNKLVGAIKVQTTSLFIHGLRTELELQFAGIYKLSGKMFYPSRSLDFPIYPFIHFIDKSSPVNIFDSTGSKMAQYRDASFLYGGGVGVNISKNWDIEISYNKEHVNARADIAFRNFGYFPDFGDNLSRVDVALNFDNLDNVVLPRNGTRISIDTEISDKRLGSPIIYNKIDIRGESYNTFNGNHTIRIHGSYLKGWNNVPIYKLFYLGGPKEFIGLDYTQLFGSRIAIAGIDYRYEFKKDIFLKLLFNAAFDYRFGFPGEEQINGKPIYGFGIGAEFLSILGPLQLIIANGEQSPNKLGTRKFYYYITAGYKF